MNRDLPWTLAVVGAVRGMNPPTRAADGIMPRSSRFEYAEAIHEFFRR